MAFCLLPRWYGEPQDVGNFLDEVSTKLGNDEGLAVYAMVAGGLRQSHRSTSELSLLGIDMKKVNAGGSVLARRYPFANQFLNLACWAASEQRDRPRARDLFGWIGPNPDSTYWGDEQVFQRIRAWATENDTGRQQEQCILASFFGLESIAFSPDGKRLAVGGIEALRQLTIWDVESGKELIVLPHPAPIHSLEYSPDGKLLAVAGGDGSNAQLVVWNFGDNEPDPTVLMGPEGELRAVTFSPDGKQLAAGGQDDHVWIWDTSKWNRSPEKIAWKSRVRLPDGIPDADELRRLLPTQETTIGDLRFSPDGRYLAILGGRTLLSLDRTNATPGSVFLYRNGLPYRLGRFGEELLIGGSPNFVERTAFSDVSPRNFYSLLSNDGNPVVTSVDASADGSLVAAGLHLPGRLSGEVGGGAVSIYDPRGRFGKVVTLLEGHNDRVGDIKFSPDGKRLASAGWDGTLRIWRVPPLPAIEEATAGKNASTAIGRGRSGPSANVGNDGTSGR
jgi:WD40 repeat protein